MSKQTVGSIMERDAYRCRDTATLDEVTAQLIERGVSSLPVVDERNRVVGFISDGDIMRAIAEHKTRSIFSGGARPSLLRRRVHRGQGSLPQNAQRDGACRAQGSLRHRDQSIGRVADILSKKKFKKLPSSTMRESSSGSYDARASCGTRSTFCSTSRPTNAFTRLRDSRKPGVPRRRQPPRPHRLNSRATAIGFRRRANHVRMIASRHHAFTDQDCCVKLQNLLVLVSAAYGNRSGRCTMFFYEPLSATAIVSVLLYLVFLIGMNELSRLSKWVGGVLFIALPLVLTIFVWPHTAVEGTGAGTWFQWVKTYSCLAEPFSDG